MSRKFTDEELVKAFETSKSKCEVARKLGVAESSVRARLKSLANKGYSPEHGYINLVPDGYKVQGVSTLYNSENKPVAQWVKSAIDKDRQHELLENMCKALVVDLPKYPEIVQQAVGSEDLLTVYPLGDPHIGMMAWGKETEIDWDLEKAEKVYIEYFKRIILCAPASEKAVIVNLGDFFHYDNLQGYTAKSHNILDRDSRYAKMVEVGIKILRVMIATALGIHNKVHVITVTGNHDEVGSIFLRIALKHIYANEPRVTIDDTPGLFHYLRHGKTLIGTHHGHTCKMDLLPGVMACDRSKDWGETEFRYWLTGHIHSDTKIDKAGCIVESFRTLAPRDAYAHEHGWRNGRNIKCIVYHKESGELERHTVNIGVNHE